MSDTQVAKKVALALGAALLVWLLIFLIGYGAVALVQDLT